jgi:hypothetical protein
MITVELLGRLGNQMFQYAVCRTIAEKNGYSFHIPYDLSINDGHNISNYFSVDMGSSDGEIIYKFSEDARIQKFNPEIFNIPDGTLIWGFYQTDKYFKENESNVKSWFKVDLDEKTESILNLYNKEDYCFIHFRGTDYKQFDSGSRFLPKKYFEDAKNLVKKKKSDIKFIVITDDIEEAKNYFPEDKSISNEMMVDFKLLYYSKYCIIPNSTFSWWAAWLSDKIITVAPNNWLNYQMPHLGFYPVDIKVEKFNYV